MPAVAWYMVAVAVFIWMARRSGDRRRAAALGLIWLAMPTTFVAYNLAEDGPFWAMMIWLITPIVIYQWLKLWGVAALGGLLSPIYGAIAFELAPEYPLQLISDILGLLMIAAAIGPVIRGMVGDIKIPYWGGGVRHLVAVRDSIVAGAQKWTTR